MNKIEESVELPGVEERNQQAKNHSGVHRPVGILVVGDGGRESFACSMARSRSAGAARAMLLKAIACADSDPSISATATARSTAAWRSVLSR